jgi:ABC-type transporter Mla MlaB component
MSSPHKNGLNAQPSIGDLCEGAERERHGQPGGHSEVLGGDGHKLRDYCTAPSARARVTGPPARTLLLEVWGPLARTDLEGLYARTCALLAEHETDLVLCGVAGVDPDAVAVEALARLQLDARRRGAEVRLHGASPELLQVVDFMGLAEVLPEESA